MSDLEARVQRLEITQMLDESPMLSLRDAASKILLTLIAKEGNSGIYLYDSERRPRAILSAGQQPAPGQDKHSAANCR